MELYFFPVNQFPGNVFPYAKILMLAYYVKLSSSFSTKILAPLLIGDTINS